MGDMQSYLLSQVFLFYVVDPPEFGNAGSERHWFHHSFDEILPDRDGGAQAAPMNVI
jgi:hypothetical protein